MRINNVCYHGGVIFSEADLRAGFYLVPDIQVRDIDHENRLFNNLSE